MRKEKLPELAGWYRPALYGILLLVTVIMGFYSAVQLTEAQDPAKAQDPAQGQGPAEFLPEWVWNASKVVFYGGLTTVAVVAGSNNLLVRRKLKGYDRRVKKFVNAAEGASSVINSGQGH